MDITGWSTLKSDWLYSLQPKMQKLYTVCKNKTGGWLWLRSWTPYCQLKLKKVGKTTRPFKYDLNQILYDYTVEVRKRFKGLDLIDRVPEELWTEVRDIVQETGIKTIPMEKKCKKAKWLSGEALQRQRNQRSNCQHSLDHEKSKRVAEKHLFLLYWLCQSLWLCESQ